MTKPTTPAAPTKKAAPTKQAAPAKKAAPTTKKSTPEPAPASAAVPADDWFAAPLRPVKAVLSNRPKFPEQANQHGRYNVEPGVAPSTAKPASSSSRHATTKPAAPVKKAPAK